MTITFFKQQELIDANNLMSVALGEEALKKVTEGWYSLFDKRIANINDSIKAIVAGWRRGYSPEAVADFIISERRFSGSVLGEGYSSLEDTLVDNIYALMGYDGDHWGGQYHYRPALEEVDRDPLEVQVEINTRAIAAGKAFGGETVYFGSYQNNTGTVKSEDELKKVVEFRLAVISVLRKRQAQFFTVTTEDTENV